jgi:hypothetical protein
LKLARGVTGCGTERAAVKHLTDGFAVPKLATAMTVDQLLNMTAPPVTWNSARFPVEKQLVRITNARVIAVKQEPDSDLHVILASAAGGEINVEAPMAACDSTSPYAAVLAKARAAMDAAMPNVSSTGYTPVSLTATLEGVLFFDVLHGQRGAANGVELHPVTFFSAGPAAPPTTSSTHATSSTLATTTVARHDSGPVTTTITFTTTAAAGTGTRPPRSR